MSENNNKNPLSRVPRKPNFQGWIVVLLIAAILGITMLSKNSSVRPASPKQFERMVKNNDVKSVVIVNDKIAEITLTQQALNKPEYRAVAGQKPYFNSNNAGPHYSFEVPSAESFKNDLERLEKDVPDNQRIDDRYETRPDWVSSLATYGVVIVMILAMYFILGRMSGTGGARWSDF